jgi:hypothetical protein
VGWCYSQQHPAHSCNCLGCVLFQKELRKNRGQTQKERNAQNEIGTTEPKMKHNICAPMPNGVVFLMSAELEDIAPNNWLKFPRIYAIMIPRKAVQYEKTRFIYSLCHTGFMLHILRVHLSPT